MPDGRTFLGSAPVEQVMRVEVVRARVRDRGRGRGRGRVNVAVPLYGTHGVADLAWLRLGSG